MFRPLPFLLLCGLSLSPLPGLANESPSPIACSASSAEFELLLWATAIESDPGYLGEMQEALELVEIMRQEIGPGDPPLSLVFALILVESGGLREVRSTKGAVGLMQIMPETGAGIAQELGWRDFRSRKLLRARINIQLGLWYLRYLFEAFPQSERAALAAYYWGPGTIRRRLEQGERLPRQYPGKIRKIQRRLKEYMNHGRQIHYRQCRPG